ncbi:hypothetical protein [Paraburkholderia ultramafica]|nr:hypothetical protein [Paraburkholderia ultramafica]
MKTNTRNRLMGMAVTVTFGLAPAAAFAHGKPEHATPAAKSGP